MEIQEDEYGNYEEATLCIGDNVLWYDRHGRPRAALVQAIHGNATIKRYTYYSNPPQYPTPVGKWVNPPSINVALISDNEDKTDSYGRQIEHETSVPHHQDQQARGYFWDFVVDL